MKKFSNGLDKFILGAFTGAVLVIIFFALISWNQVLNFKDIATPIVGLLTLSLGIYTASKVLQWYESKKNDQGFEMAKSVVMATYNCIAINSNLKSIIDNEIDVLIKDNKELDEHTLKSIDTAIENNKKIYLEEQMKAYASSMSLDKWNIKRKTGMPEPLNRVMKSIEQYLKFLRWVSSNKKLSYIDFIEKRIELSELEEKLRIEIVAYNKLSIDDIYEFNTKNIVKNNNATQSRLL